MMNMIEIDGEKVVVFYDPDIQKLRGEFVGLNGGADFYAENVKDLIAEGWKSLSVFLDLYKEKGIAMRSGKGRSGKGVRAWMRHAAQ